MAETVEETYETSVTRKVVRTSLKIQETSSTTTTTTMTTPAKLYGKDLSAYDDIDVDTLLSQLSQEEITMLAKEVDPDDTFLPPSQRTSYDCEKDPTGPLNRKKLIEHINKQALETPDIPELKPFVAGIIRGKKWTPPPESAKMKEAEEQIAIDLGNEYEEALNDATQEEIIDLAAILGFHSMMNQDQYHASLLNKGQPVGLGWDGITKASMPKTFPMDPPNSTDPETTIKQVKDDDQKLIDLNWNNIKNISDEKFDNLFEALMQNTHLEVLNLSNCGITDKTAGSLADALERNNTLRVVNVESNFISPPLIVRLMKALLKTKTVEEFRASNQRSSILGNKIEMEITQLVEQNPTLVRLGLHLEYSDARHRIASHLQKNIDRNFRLKNRVNASFNLKLPRTSLINNEKLSNSDMITPPSAVDDNEKATPDSVEGEQKVIPPVTAAEGDEKISPPSDSVEGEGKVDPIVAGTEGDEKVSPPLDSVVDQPVMGTEGDEKVSSPDASATPAPSTEEIDAKISSTPNVVEDNQTVAPTEPAEGVEKVTPSLTESETPSDPSVQPNVESSIDPQSAETEGVKESENFVRAEPLEFNPNPHSTPVAQGPDKLVDP